MSMEHDVVDVTDWLPQLCCINVSEDCTGSWGWKTVTFTDEEIIYETRAPCCCGICDQDTSTAPELLATVTTDRVCLCCWRLKSNVTPGRDEYIMIGTGCNHGSIRSLKNKLHAARRRARRMEAAGPRVLRMSALEGPPSNMEMRRIS